jgi:uncharacterized membrane protein SpoIIM required for sporulation
VTSAGTTPRGVDRFVAERSEAWAELAGLVAQAHGRLDRLPADDVLRLGDGYRAAAADLARARQRWPGDPIVGELDDLVKQARSLVYRRPTRRKPFVHWLTTGFFQRVRERPRALVAAMALLWGPSIGFAIWANGDPATATRVAAISPLSRDAADSASGGGGGGRGLGSLESASLSTEIFTNNIRVSLLCLAGGLTGGLLTAGLLLFNGLVVGVVVGLFCAAGAGDTLISYIAPHGVLEWSLVAVAGAAGLRVGAALIAPGLQPRVDALVAEAKAAAEMALGVALWLVPTGLIEGFVTPTGLSPPVALAFGCGAAGVFWGLVFWRGRPAPHATGT